MTTPTPRPGILDITPYVPGSSEGMGTEKPYKLSANESALGPSPKAMEAFKTCERELHRYPDGDAAKLREAIAARYGYDPSHIVCGAGSDELLQLLSKAYLGPGDNIVQTRHGFLVYALAAKSCGADVKFAAETNLTADVDTILSEVDAATRIVFIANPNNPTGSYIPDREMRRLRDELREDILLVIDAAYAEFVEEEDYASGEELVRTHDNVVMTRTFSKIYGLGALRLGWAYCPPAIADVLHRIRGPFNVNAPAIAAGIAAINDIDFEQKNRDHNAHERGVMIQALRGAGLDVAPSVGNFLLVKFPDTPGKTAPEMQVHLQQNGVIVREMGAYGLGDYLRISIGETPANRKAIDILTAAFSL